MQDIVRFTSLPAVIVKTRETLVSSPTKSSNSKMSSLNIIMKAARSFSATFQSYSVNLETP